MSTKLLIIGYGSIGQRHYNNFLKQGLEVKVLSRRTLDGVESYTDLKTALTQFSPNLIVISVETSKHYEYLLQLVDLGFKGKILCEKPIGAEYFPDENLEKIKNQVHVTYNLRFHPFIRKLKQELKGQKLLSFNAYVGQYLPDWRPHLDYRENYSAKKDQGGGVLRELSHEIDYALYLFGKPARIRSCVRKVSTLEINTEDLVMIDWDLAQGGIGHLQMNFLDRKISRFIIANTSDHTYKVDFINGEFWKDKEKETFSSERNVTYENMVEKVMKNDWTEFTNFDEAMLSMKIIALCEESEVSGTWSKL